MRNPWGFAEGGGPFARGGLWMKPPSPAGVSVSRTTALARKHLPVESIPGGLTWRLWDLTKASPLPTVINPPRGAVLREPAQVWERRGNRAGKSRALLPCRFGGMSGSSVRPLKALKETVPGTNGTYRCSPPGNAF